MASGLRGILNASFEFVARLQRAGHTITYACPHDVGNYVRAQGISYRQLPPVNFSPAPPTPAVDPDFAGIRTRLEKWRTAATRREQGVQALRMDEFINFLDETRPDLILIDSELYEHIFAIHQTDYPIALITPWFSKWKARGLPPLQSDIIPGRGLRGSRAGLEFEWLSARLSRWLSVKKTSLRCAFTERRAVLRQYADAVSFPLETLEQFSWVTLFNDNRLPTLSLTAKELDFPHHPPNHFYYTGPMVSLSRKETDVSDADNERLQKVFSERKKNHRPLIYCWLTTMDDRGGEFIERVVAAVSPRSDWLLLLGHGGSPVKALDDLPANVYKFDYVPQIEVMQNADLCITLGGINTINESLTCGVPLLVYPTGSADQKGCAARVAFHGLGYLGDISKDAPADIARKIEMTLKDRKIRDRVSHMRETLDGYRRQRTAEGIVDKLLECSRSSRSFHSAR